jgi:hypothetical protein
MSVSSLTIPTARSGALAGLRTAVACALLTLAAVPASAQSAKPAAASTAPASPAPAGGSGTYAVEVIVFRAPGGGGGAAPSAAPSRGAADTAGTQVARYIGPLPGGRLQLGGAREKLARGGYRILVHTGWVQTAASWGAPRSGLPLERLGINVPGLSGSFQLERGSLLHFGMTLRHASEGGPPSQINEIRRIRFNERNYYDHPSIGVIAVVTPGG